MAVTTITSADRLGVTVVFALILHGIILLGVGFGLEDPPAPPPSPSLDVILIHKKGTDPPKKADFLAQANQLGGGTTHEKTRPASPLAGVVPKKKVGLAPAPVKEQRPEPKRRRPHKLIDTRRSPKKVMKTARTPETPKPPQPTTSQIMQHSLEVARLEAEIGRELRAYAKRPRRKFISANTREYLYASYMQAWVSKVERVGNLNYPDQARRNKLSGNLVMTVAIDVDGNTESIEIITPSGHQVLDDAARRIVELATPFAPLPKTILEKTDVLHITRTWQFLPGNVLRHQ